MEAKRTMLALVLVCSLIQIASLEKAEPIKINIGGGDCIDPEDCGENGFCRQDAKDKQKATCNCIVGFTKPNCEAEDKGSKLGPGVKGKAGKRSHVHHHQTGSKREQTAAKRRLEYDPGSDLFGLDPKVLAEAGQEFLIYNPDKKVYLFVSNDMKATGKRVPYIEARGDRAGLRNIFTFTKVDGQAGKYYIKNKDTNKFLYMSNSKSGFFRYWNNNILGADENAKNAKFIFEIKDEDGDGFYKIVNQGKSLYVSAHMLGIPMHRLVKATDQKELERWHSQFFQFALKDKAKEVKFETKGDPKKKVKTLVDAAQSSKSCHKGDPVKDKDKDLDIQVAYKETKTESRTYTETNGFTFSGNLKDTYGGLTFTYSHTLSDAETNTKTTETTRTVGLKVSVNRCACIKVTYNFVEYDQDYEVTAKSKEDKVLKATGQVKGSSLNEFEVHTEMFDYTANFKCPWET